MTIHLAFVAGELSDGGGVNRVIRDLASIFAQEPHTTVTVIGVGATGEPSYPFSPDVRLKITSAGRPIGWRAAIQILREERPDFAIGSWTQTNLILILALLFSSTRVVVVEHTSWHFLPLPIRILRRMIYPFAWRVVVVNPSELNHYSSYLRNVRLIPNPVFPAPERPLQQREKLIVAIGHLWPRKNMIEAIEAMAASGLEHSGWELAVIGAGGEEKRVQNAILSAKLTRTQIHSPTAEINYWYNRASLIVVPSKVEVFSLVLAEAMSAGVVPIAYAAEGPSFILRDFPNHLVPMGDKQMLATRMRNFATGGPMTRLRSSLRASVLERFSPAVIARKWFDLFEEASRSTKPGKVRRALASKLADARRD